MKITLNGEELKIEKSITFKELLSSLDIDERKVAIERNLEIVSRSRFDEDMLNEGDNIEIIHFIGGG